MAGLQDKKTDGGQVKLQQGMQAPDFELRDDQGETWKLSDLRGKRVVLFFYPADDTPGCTREACDFRDTHEYWQDAGYVVLGISPQGVESKRAFKEKFDLNFPLLADVGMDVQKAYGTTLDEDGLFWGKIPLRTKRSTFVIDEEGRIAEALYGVRSKGHVAGLRETLGV